VAEAIPESEVVHQEEDAAHSVADVVLEAEDNLLNNRNPK